MIDYLELCQKQYYMLSKHAILLGENVGYYSDVVGKTMSWDYLIWLSDWHKDNDRSLYSAIQEYFVNKVTGVGWMSLTRSYIGILGTPAPL